MEVKQGDNVLLCGFSQAMFDILLLVDIPGPIFVSLGEH